jgi:hypothetical protein
MDQARKDRRSSDRSLVDESNPPASWDDEARGTKGWITRNQAADLLGVSSQILLMWERKGRIHAKMAYRFTTAGRYIEQVVYDPNEIIQLPRRSLRPIAKDPDELAARATELFESGMNDREIVLELRVDYAKVARLRDAWMDAGGATRVLTRDQALAFAELLGPFETLAELLERVRSGALGIPANAEIGTGTP